MDQLPYNRHDLPNYLRAKLESAVELYAAGKISKSELFRNEIDLIHMTDSGPIKMSLPQSIRKER